MLRSDREALWLEQRRKAVARTAPEGGADIRSGATAPQETSARMRMNRATDAAKADANRDAWPPRSPCRAVTRRHYKLAIGLGPAPCRPAAGLTGGRTRTRMHRVGGSRQLLEFARCDLQEIFKENHDWLQARIPSRGYTSGHVLRFTRVDTKALCAKQFAQWWLARASSHG
jgi:hypothetical protein